MKEKEEETFSAGSEVRGENIPPVQRLKRELKYQGTILKMYEDTVNVNGHEAKWDFIHHDGAAAVVAVNHDGKLLMVRQYRNALDRYTLEIPAGKLDYPGHRQGISGKPPVQTDQHKEGCHIDQGKYGGRYPVIP